MMIATLKQGLHGIPFGTSRADVIRVFAETPKVVNRIGRDYDYFLRNALNVQYDRNGKFEAVEFHPAQPASGLLPVDVVIEHGAERVEPFSMSAVDLLNWVRARDAEVEVDGAGFKSVPLGIGAYANWLTSTDLLADSAWRQKPADSVVVFRDGYYDESAFLEALSQVDEWLRANGIEPPPVVPPGRKQ
jgi:hypothetical protein